MSEGKAKRKARNVLRVLTAEEAYRQVGTSPRPDLTSSQELLAVKYRELATLLATQHVERKTVSRLESTNLVSWSTGCTPSATRQRSHDNRVKPMRRRHRKGPAPSEPDDSPKMVELRLSDTRAKGAPAELHLNLEQLALPRTSKKTVSFSKARLIKGTDDCASSSTDMSDTELVRRILRSPRKFLVNKHSSISVTASRSSSNNKKTSKPKKKTKMKNTPKETRGRSQRNDDPNRGLTETPREKKELPPTDNKLSSSHNPDILTWLKEKNRLTRSQRRDERKKERQKQAAEERDAQEKLRRNAESEDKFNQWMKDKKDESHRRYEINRKATAKGDAVQKTEVEQGQMQTPPKQTTAESRTQTQKTASTGKATKPQRTVSGSDSENPSNKATRRHLARNPEAERLRGEEEGQQKEAEKQRRKLLKEAHAEDANKRDSGSGTDAEPASKTSASKSQSDNRKTMPSSNPFKGLSYDDWARQKQADQRRQAREAKKQEVICDPQLDDLIPLLARRRIEQIKVRATRVDSGLRRSNSENKTNRPRTPNGVRPYTWNSVADNQQKPTMKPTPPKTRKSDRNKTLSTPMPDVVNFARPEPQGCEGNEQYPCQRPKNNESRDTSINQSEPSTNKLRDSTAHRNNPNENDEEDFKQASDTNIIFMTEPIT